MVIINRRSKKERKYNGQKKQDKQKDNDLQNTTQKTKELVSITSLRTWKFYSCSTSGDICQYGKGKGDIPIEFKQKHSNMTSFVLFAKKRTINQMTQSH